MNAAEWEVPAPRRPRSYSGVAGGGAVTEAAAAAAAARAAASLRVVCVVCHVGVRGVAWSCSQCGHGGHWKCIEGWFSGGAKGPRLHCPAGCGCTCALLPPPGADDAADDAAAEASAASPDALARAAARRGGGGGAGGGGAPGSPKAKVVSPSGRQRGPPASPRLVGRSGPGSPGPLRPGHRRSWSGGVPSLAGLRERL